MRLPLLGGSYSARSPIANSQRCINYYPEHNTKDALVPVTYYQRPGLRPLVTAEGGGAVRGLYLCASTNTGYAVIGAGVYQINPTTRTSWSLTKLGTIAAGTSPVSLQDNRNQILLVDGTTQAYTIDCMTNAFAPFVDPSGLFTGATRVDYIDTFTLWNFLNSNLFGSTLSNSLEIDPTYFAAKTGRPDNLQTLIVSRNLLLLIGQFYTELWYDAGGALFPFARQPGVFYPHGTPAPYSPARQDISAYFLGQDEQGIALVFRVKGFECVRISNHALEYQLQQMIAQGQTLSDAIGYTYQFNGHVFYVLTFPSGNQTWQFDEATQEWSQLCWTDGDGNLNRHRGMSGAFIAGQYIIGDHSNGTLYALDQNVYTDQLTTGGAPGPVTYVRTFPQLGGSDLQVGPAKGFSQQALSEGSNIFVRQFQLDIECGAAPLDINGNPAQVLLRWSADRARTFGNALALSIGAPGEFRTRPQALNLGLAQFPVFEIEHSIAGPAALNGAWVLTQAANV